MTSQLLFLPFTTVYTSHGLPAGGAGVTFFLTGTTTKTPVFADDARTTQLPNPVPADALGRIPAVYLNPSITYRVRIIDANGATIGEVDPYIPGTFGQSFADAAFSYSAASAASEAQARMYAEGAQASENAVNAALAAGFAVVLGQVGYDPVTHQRYMTVPINSGAGVGIYAYPHYYVDYDAASGGTGTTSATTGANRAFSSLTEMSIVLGTNISGKTIGVKGGSTWRRDGLDLRGRSDLQQVNIIAYGGLLRLDGTDVVPNAVFTPYGGVSGAYTVSRPSYFQNGGSFARLWQNEKPWQSKGTAAETSAAGTAWTNGFASTTGTQAVVGHPYGSTDPRTDGALYEMTVRDAGIGLPNNSSCQGVHARRFGSHDGNFRGGIQTSFTRCLTEQGTVHNAVVAGDLTDFFAINCMEDVNVYAVGAPIMITHYVDGSATGMTAKLTRAYGIADASVYSNSIPVGGSSAAFHYSHDNANGLWGRLDFNQCSIIGLQAGITANIAYVQDLYVPSGFNVGSTATPAVSANYRSIIGFYTEDVQRLTGPGNITQAGPVENGLMIQENSGLSGGAIFHNNVPLAQLSIKNVILVASGTNENTEALLDDESTSASSTNSLTHCIIDGSRQPAAFAGNGTVTADYNLYRAQGVNEPSLQKPLYNSYSFADWQTLGYDTHSYASIGGAGTADPQWLSGNKPTMANPDPTLDPAGRGYAALTFHITKAYVDGLRARPSTLAAAVSYLETNAPVTGVVL